MVFHTAGHLQSRNVCSFAILQLSDLMPHEGVEEERLIRIIASLRHEGMLRRPIIVDRGSLVILDGHHRAMALRLLSSSFVPAFIVDYFHPSIEVTSLRPELEVTKDLVIKRALSGNLYPPRTSWHVLAAKDVERPVRLATLFSL